VRLRAFLLLAGGLGLTVLGIGGLPHSRADAPFWWFLIVVGILAIFESIRRFGKK
jgi:hypothetical protein